jgi:hypothetical protein
MAVIAIAVTTIAVTTIAGKQWPEKMRQNR